MSGAAAVDAVHKTGKFDEKKAENIIFDQNHQSCARDKVRVGMSFAEQVVAELRRGGSAGAIAARLGTSQVFIEVVIDHLQRAGLVNNAGSLCSSGLGACGSAATMPEASVACAGCPLTR